MRKVPEEGMFPANQDVPSTEARHFHQRHSNSDNLLTTGHESRFINPNITSFVTPMLASPNTTMHPRYTEQCRATHAKIPPAPRYDVSSGRQPQVDPLPSFLIRRDCKTWFVDRKGNQAQPMPSAPTSRPGSRDIRQGHCTRCRMRPNDGVDQSYDLSRY